MKREDRLNLIKNDLKKSRNILNVLGDVNTLNILLVLFENCSSGGVMVKDISQSVNLSRPAVSHHLKKLLDNEIISVEKRGVKNYYHITGIEQILSLKSLFNNIEIYCLEGDK